MNSRLILHLLLLFFVQQVAYAQPTNDDCAQVINLGEAPICPDDIFDNIDATASNIATLPGDNIPSCWSNVNNDVWFSFTTPVDGSYLDFSITVGGAVGGPNNMPMVQPQIAIYRGDCAIDDLSELACASFIAGQSIVNTDVFGLDPATTYFIRVNDFSATATPNWGDFMICVDSISNAVNILATTANDSICSGSSTQLSATGIDNVDVFFWEPANSLSDPNSPSPTASPNSTTTYTLSATNYGDNLITNGDFEMGNTAFTTDYTLGSDSLPLTIWGTLGYEGTYEILTNPNDGHSNFANCGDHTTGTGNMMVVNGSAVSGEFIWCQNIIVEPNTDYQFSAWVTTVVASNPAILQFSVNGLLVGTPYSASFATCNWQQFSSTWNSGVAVTAEVCISNQNISPSGNDFAIDDINFSTFSEGESSVTIYVSNPSITINNETDATCSGICDGSAEVMASGGFTTTGYDFLWSNGQTIPLIGNLCAGTYNITITDDIGCTATQNVVINEAVFSVAVQELPSSPCEEQQDADVTLVFGNGTEPFIINWSSGGNEVVETGLGNGQYSVSVEDANGCNTVQDFSIELFTGLNPASISAAPGDTICLGEFVSMTASGGSSGIFEWNTGVVGPLLNDFPTSETTYSITTYTPGKNLIANGDFEGGNVGFTSDHNYHQLPTDGMCEGCYGVAHLPPALWTQCGDHTTGNGNHMIFNAATTAGLSSWCQTVTITPNTAYMFSFWGQRLNNGAAANLVSTFDGVPLPGSLILSTPGCQWQQYSSNWNSGNLTAVEICINNLQTNGGGNDFSLDDISLIPLCEIVAEKTIYVSDLNASIVNQMDIGCDNPFGAAGVFAEGGFSPYQYQWEDGSTEALNENLSAGVHTVTVSDDGAYCAAVLSVEILQSDPLEITSYDFAIAGCDPANGIDLLPNSLLIEVIGGEAPYSYSIDNGNTSQITALFDNLNPEQSSFEILVTDALGCEAMITTPVIENTAPTANISSSEDSFCGSDLILNLNTNISSPTQIIWSTGDTTSSTVIMETGLFSVSAWNELNCVATAEITIEECGQYAIPNAFTPDGDGQNDHFGPLISGNVQLLEMAIYNRWGEEVYRGNSNWDGTQKGQPQPMDVYIYRIELMVKGVNEVHEGDLTLMR